MMVCGLEHELTADLKEAASAWSGRNHPLAWRAAGSGRHSAGDAEDAIKRDLSAKASNH
jgi:hypothetical protein